MAATAKLQTPAPQPATPLERLHSERAGLTRELAALNASSARLNETANAEAGVLAEIVALSDQDTAAMKKWAAGGCVGEPPAPDQKLRKALGEKLSTAQAAAFAARGAGADIDQKIGELNASAQAIAGQIEQAIFDEMEIEHSKFLTEYRTICEHGIKLAAKLHGLCTYFGDTGRTLISQGNQDVGARYLNRASALTNIRLPNPGCTRNEIEAAAHEWGRRAATLRNGA